MWRKSVRASKIPTIWAECGINHGACSCIVYHIWLIAPQLHPKRCKNRCMYTAKNRMEHDPHGLLRSWERRPIRPVVTLQADIASGIAMVMQAGRGAVILWCRSALFAVRSSPDVLRRVPMAFLFHTCLPVRLCCRSNVCSRP